MTAVATAIPIACVISRPARTRVAAATGAARSGCRRALRITLGAMRMRSACGIDEPPAASTSARAPTAVRVGPTSTAELLVEISQDHAPFRGRQQAPEQQTREARRCHDFPCLSRP